MEVHGMELKTEMETQPLGFSSYVSWSSTHLQFLITCFAILYSLIPRPLPHTVFLYLHTILGAGEKG